MENPDSARSEIVSAKGGFELPIISRVHGPPLEVGERSFLDIGAIRRIRAQNGVAERVTRETRTGVIVTIASDADLEPDHRQGIVDKVFIPDDLDS